MNPYSFLDPVTEPKMFYGYHAELERIVNNVAAPGRERQSFFVAGAGRMGKTSLLLQAERRLRLLGPERVVSSYQQLLIPLYLDMQHPAASTPKGFFDMVTRMLSEYLKDTSLSFEIPIQTIAALESVMRAVDPLNAFTNCLRELVQSIRPIQLRIVLLIDDLFHKRHKLERVSSSDRENIISLSLKVLHTTRSIENIMAYVITGSYQEHTLVRLPGSPLESILLLNYLHVFEEEQSLALINTPTGDKIPSEVVHEIYKESGGHPYLIQYLMSALCEKPDPSRSEMKDVFEATVRFAKERRDFEKWWENLGEIDGRVYGIFCHGEPTRGSDLIQIVSEMLSLTGKRQRHRPLLDIGHSLHALGTSGLIRERQDGLFELAGQWPSRWFRQMALDYMPGNSG